MDQEIENSAAPQHSPGGEDSSSLDSGAVAPTGRREAFRDLRRQLTDDELTDSGVQKLLLEMLERAETECEVLKGYVERFYDSQTRVAVLIEKVKTTKSNEILFAVCLTLGGAIIGLAPTFWKNQPQGWLALIIGGILILVGIVARITGR